jgi:hypothetical protein
MAITAVPLPAKMEGHAGKGTVRHVDAFMQRVI